MRNEMLQEDIIDMNVIDELLSNPLTSVNSDVEIDCRDITSPREFNKVMYLVYDGKLRQFKIKKGLKFPFNWTKTINGQHITNILIIEVAGLGEFAVSAAFWGYTFNFVVYDSIEDFKQGNGRNLKREWLGNARTLENDVYGNIGIHSKKLSRWYWNGTNAKVQSLKQNISLFFTYDKDGFNNNMFTWYYGGYATKEECEENNAIQVEVFSDSEAEEEKPTTIKIRISEIEVEIPKSKLGELEEYARTLSKK